MRPDITTLVASILDTHHALLKRELPRLALALKGRDAAVRIPFAKLRGVLDEHLMKEENILFPMILSLAADEEAAGCGVEGPIMQMRHEHETIRALEAELRAAAHLAGEESAALLALLDDLGVHAGKEDDVLFPAAISMRSVVPRRAEPDEEEPRVARPARRAPAAPHTAAPQTAAPAVVSLVHLGYSGLRLTINGAELTVDPPEPAAGPVVLTWSEAERVAGAKTEGARVAASPGVLRFLGIEGTPLTGGPVMLDGFELSTHPYTPIPYATAPEAIRKTRSALHHPLMAARRLAFTVRRPADAPLALRIRRDGVTVVLLGQALHRFLSKAELKALAAWAGPANLVVAGTDYDDEAAVADALAAFVADTRLVADLTGDVRREIGLPVRPLEHSRRGAPLGTLPLETGCAWVPTLASSHVS